MFGEYAAFNLNDIYYLTNVKMLAVEFKTNNFVECMPLNFNLPACILRKMTDF